jgi:hypothetical protein
MDYFGMFKILSCLAFYIVLLDIPRNITAIPGDNNKPVTFIHILDIGRFVAASLDFEK